MGYAAKTYSLGGALALLTAVLGAGCSTKLTDGGFACPQLALAPPALVYPQPSATAVPPSLGLVLLTPNGLALTDFTLTIRPSVGAPLPLGLPEPAPSPLPSGVPTPFPFEVYDAASVPQLQANGTYTVHLTQTNPPTGACSFDRSGDIGSFSTGS